MCDFVCTLPLCLQGHGLKRSASSASTKAILDKNLSTLGNGHVNAGYNEADKPEDDSWYVDMITGSGTAAEGADPAADPFSSGSQTDASLQTQPKGIPTRSASEKQPEGRYVERGQVPNITASAQKAVARSNTGPGDPLPLPSNMPSISRGERTQSMKPTQQAPQLPARNLGQSMRQGTQAREETNRGKTMGAQRQQGQFRMSQMGNNMDMKKRQEEIQQKKEHAAMVQQGPRPPSDRRTDQSRPLPTPKRAGYEDVKVRPARKKSSLKQTESQQQTTGGLRPVGIQVPTHGGDYYSAAQLRPVSLQAPVGTDDYCTTSGGGLRPVGLQAPSGVEGYYTVNRGT